MKRMRTKLTRAGLVLAALAYVVAILVVPLLTNIASGTAHAASGGGGGEQYLFYYDPSDASAIEKSFSGPSASTVFGTSSSSFDSAFNQTKIYAKGGVFGSNPVAFTFNQTASTPTGGGTGGTGSGGAVSLDYDSSTQISCIVKKALPGEPNQLQTPYQISYPLTIYASPTKANIKNNQPVSVSLSIDTSTVTVVAPGSVEANMSDSESIWFGQSPNHAFSLDAILGQDTNNVNGITTKPSPSTVIPKSCLPSGLSLSSGFSGSIQAQNYAGLSKSAQKNWPGVGKTAAAPSKSKSSPSPSTPSPSPDCSFLSSNPLNWIICPVVFIMTEGVDFVDGLITNELNINTNTIFCTTPNSTCSAYYDAWKSIRDFALGLMAIAGLIIVTAQALGLEMLDAYTVRKALPRLLIATIGIALSWPLMDFLINLSNALGVGVRDLIYAPFSHLHSGLDLTIVGGSGFASGIGNFFAGGGVAVAGSAATAAWLILSGPVAILSALGTALLAVLVAVVVLILRQVVITALMLLAPLAIIAYVLPNTQRVYRLWWDTFMKALLMFPLIAAMIAAGRVFSAISISAGGNEGINQVIGLIAYIAPYFMIPLTFRMSGAAMSGLGNFVQGRAQGGFNYLSKVRADSRQKRREMYAQKFKTGGFKPILPARKKGALGWAYRRNIGLVNATNNVGRRLNAGLIRGGLGFGARGETALEGSLMEGVEAATKEPAMHENATINGFNRLMVLMAKHGGDETAAMADLRAWYSSGRNEYNRPFQGHDLEEKLTDAQARLRNVGGYNPARAVSAYLAMGRDGTAIRDVRDSGEIAAWVSEGSTATAYNLLSQVASDSKRVGRSELSPSQDHKAALVEATVAAHKGQTPANYAKVIDGATMSGAGGEGAYTVMMNAPSRVVRGNVEHAMDIIRRYNTSPGSVDFRDAAQAARVIRDLQTNSHYAKTDNKVTLLEAMSAGDREEQLDTFLQSAMPTTFTDDQGNAHQTIPATSVTDDFGDRIALHPPATAQDYVDRIAGGNRGPEIPEQARQAMDAQAHQPPEPPDQ